MSKEYLKKNDEELQEFLMFKNRGSIVESKKGKGSKYNRSRERDMARKRKNYERTYFEESE